MVEMVEILDGRLGMLSVERVRYVINNLLHLVIVKYGDISLVLCISTRLKDLLHGSACNMTRYFTSSDCIVTSRRRVEIQSTSEMSPYFTMTKCNKLFITYLTRSTERLPSLPSSISTNSTISMTVVMTTLFKKR